MEWCDEACYFATAEIPKPLAQRLDNNISFIIVIIYQRMRPCCFYPFMFTFSAMKI